MSDEVRCVNQGVQGKCITNKAKKTPFSKEKRAALGGTGTHDTLLYKKVGMVHNCFH